MTAFGDVPDSEHGHILYLICPADKLDVCPADNAKKGERGCALRKVRLGRVNRLEEIVNSFGRKGGCAPDMFKKDE